jgi:photosystem II stability/assembly factor-like uncharacterized protein
MNNNSRIATTHSLFEIILKSGRLASLCCLLILALSSCDKKESISSNGPRLGLSASSLTFQARLGTGPAQQQIQVRNTGTDQFSYTVTKTKAWLSVIPTADSVPSEILVQPIIGSLPIGTHKDTITVTALGAIGSPAKIPVTFIIGDSIRSSFASLNMSGLLHDGPLNSNLNLQSISGSVLPLTISKTSSWLTLSETSGNTPLTISLTLNPAGQSIGALVDTIVVSSPSVDHQPLRLPVQFSIVPWLPVGVNGAFDFSEVIPLAADSFVAVGYILGAIERAGWTFVSNSGAKNWQSSFNLEPGLFADIQMITRSFGWIVGDSAMLLFTSNGGQNWLRVDPDFLPVDSTVDFRSVSFVSETNGWAVGDEGAILNTVDGGATWQLQPSGTNLLLSDVAAYSATTAWVVGNGGIISKTTDGTNWGSVSSGTSTDLRSIEMVSPDSLMITGNGGLCLVTTNGGASWTPRGTGTSSPLLGIAAVGSVIWICGRDGVILRSENFGQSFVVEQSGTANALTSITFNASRYGAIVGEDGTILRTRLAP